MSETNITALNRTTGTNAPERAQDANTSSGVYQSREVKSLNAQSLLQDVSEEITMKMSEKTEKEATKRHIQAGRKADQLERLMKLNKIQEILSTLGDLNKDQLERAIKALLERRERDPHRLGERAKDQFKEPAHQYALLTAYVEELKLENAPAEEIKTAEAAVANLMKERGADIRAALNIGEVANAFAEKGLGDHQALREAYRDNIKDYKDLNSTLSDLRSRFPHKPLGESISFVMSGLAADLAVEGASIDRQQLKLILSDLKVLKTASTILNHCDILASNAKERNAASTFNKEELFKQLIPLQGASTVRPEQISAIVKTAGLDDIEDNIKLLTDLTEIVRHIPQDSFLSEQRRESFLNAAQAALDDAIEEEEGMEADDEDMEEVE
jgi:type III secretion protein W